MHFYKSRVQQRDLVRTPEEVTCTSPIFSRLNALLKLVKWNQINCWMDLVPFNQLQLCIDHADACSSRRMRKIRHQELKRQTATGATIDSRTIASDVSGHFISRLCSDLEGSA
ncbi:uncharacterized protein LOC120919525 [Rana temporaria]|uniref:uncharacterized protein LOC120919525 n=1 Tax=Rana temporaria TaxID=8407 RepID=UPI001AACCBE2|nr:uncharacterized protein LOC120919525 [Rana temporaria]XP_040187661.1 uncharacterized protein LOC120919525 [Rana temporaria]